MTSRNPQSAWLSASASILAKTRVLGGRRRWSEHEDKDKDNEDVPTGNFSGDYFRLGSIIRYYLGQARPQLTHSLTQAIETFGELRISFCIPFYFSSYIVDIHVGKRRLYFGESFILRRHNKCLPLPIGCIWLSLTPCYMMCS
jgi:hypothetical protein